MNVYLLNPPFKTNFVRCGRWQGAAARSGGLDYPKWLAYATGLLEKAYTVKLVDAVAQDWDLDAVKRDLATFLPDVIIIETNFSSLTNDIAVLDALKKISSAKTVMVGPPVHIFYEAILNSGIDVAIPFEYEWVAYDLLKAWVSGKPLETVNGIAYKANDRILLTPIRPCSTSEELDALPFVSAIYKKYLPIKKYFLSQSLYPEVQIFAGRGCPFQCSFCSWPENLTGRKYRMRSPKSIADEFSYIKKELPEVKEVFIEDDSFTVNTTNVALFCNELISRKLKIVWSCNSRGTLSYDLMRLMKKAGCRLLIVGYESGSDQILKGISKGTTIQGLKTFTKNAKKAGLLVHSDFIIGLPHETETTIKETQGFIHEIKPNLLQVAIATPIPGTKFYEFVKSNGYLLVDTMEKSIDENGYQKCVVSYPELTNEQIEAYANKILKNYYLSLSYVPTAIRNIARTNGLDELKIMLRSARTFLSYIINFR